MSIKNLYEEWMNLLCSSVDPPLTRSQAAQLLSTGVPDTMIRRLQSCIFEGLLDKDIPDEVFKKLCKEYLDFKGLRK